MIKKSHTFERQMRTKFLTERHEAGDVGGSLSAYKRWLRQPPNMRELVKHYLPTKASTQDVIAQLLVQQVAAHWNDPESVERGEVRPTFNGIAAPGIVWFRTADAPKGALKSTSELDDVQEEAAGGFRAVLFQHMPLWCWKDSNAFKADSIERDKAALEREIKAYKIALNRAQGRTRAYAVDFIDESAAGNVG